MDRFSGGRSTLLEQWGYDLTPTHYAVAAALRERGWLRKSRLTVPVEQVQALVAEQYPRQCETCGAGHVSPAQCTTCRGQQSYPLARQVAAHLQRRAIKRVVFVGGHRQIRRQLLDLAEPLGVEVKLLEAREHQPDVGTLRAVNDRSDLVIVITAKHGNLGALRSSALKVETASPVGILRQVLARLDQTA